MLSAISASNVSKTYRMYQRPVDRLLEALARRPYHYAFECLKSLSFVLPHGGTLGIIGENGAGKSTLLKILAGTLTPTAGQVQVNGRVAALLELGAGFHQEFTGRQNIYLNASLQGLSDAEIQQKEPAIIDFADLGDFIDRPIKTYSSGMNVRLAFSIATSIDPDILIIDEALSVGDQRFQQKCVERMVGFRKAGKTLIVCSHSMYMINELCKEALWLDHGAVVAHDRASLVISAYMAAQEARQAAAPVTDSVTQTDMPEVTIESVQILNPEGFTIEQIRQFETMLIRIHLKRRTEIPFKGHVALILEDDKGSVIFGALTRSQHAEPIAFQPEQTLELLLPSLPLQKGTYRARALVSDSHALRLVHQNVSSPCLIQSEHPEYGIVWMRHEWKI